MYQTLVVNAIVYLVLYKSLKSEILCECREALYCTPCRHFSPVRVQHGNVDCANFSICLKHLLQYVLTCNIMML